MIDEERALEILAILNSVNTVRARAGIPPLAEMPKGIPWDPWQCSLGRALCGARVYSSEVHLDESEIHDEHIPAIAELLDVAALPEAGGEGCYQAGFETPWRWRSFISDFDHHEYPELIEPAETRETRKEEK